MTITRSRAARTRLLAVAVAALALTAAMAGPRPDANAATAERASTAEHASTQLTASHSGTQRATTVAKAPTAGATNVCTDGFGGVILGPGLPPTPCLTLPGDGKTRWADSVLPFDPVTQVVNKPKIEFKLPPFLVRGFVLVCSNNFPPALACPFDTHLPAPDPHVALGFFGFYADLWARSTAGVVPSYGVFPSVQVSMLAFGTIPVTATVHIQQTTDAQGYRTPLHLVWLTGYGMVPGALVPGYESYGPTPAGHGQNYGFEPDPHITGQVIVSVSDVTVDGVPLEVGPNCQTETALNMTARGGFFLPGPPVEGQPGEYTPQGASYLHGNINVPAFHGCRNGNENLDPLITGMVSGPDNHLDAFQKTALQNTGCYLGDPNDPNCATKHPKARPFGGLTATQIKHLSPQLQQALASMTPAQLQAATTTGTVPAAAAAKTTH